VDILVLGGTAFVGRVLVQELLQAGHCVTCFNRGYTSQTLPIEPFQQKCKQFCDSETRQSKDLEHFSVSDKTENALSVTFIQGDRRKPPNALFQKHYDVVIDCSGYCHADVVPFCQNTQFAGRYIFLSSVAVYTPQALINESSALHNPDMRDLTELDRLGSCKVAAEQSLRATWGQKLTVLRCGMLDGAQDHAQQNTRALPFRDMLPQLCYWPLRVAHGGQIAVPQSSDQPFQLLDVRDLALFITGLLIQPSLPDCLNVIGEQLSLDAVFDALNPNETIPIPTVDLLEYGIQPFSGLPFWLPECSTRAPYYSLSNQRARDFGLKTHPIADTLKAVKAVAKDQNPYTYGGQITPEVEGDLILQASISASRVKQFFGV
jgi:2'-hydroxyisoflavone reductase